MSILMRGVVVLTHAASKGTPRCAVAPTHLSMLGAGPALAQRATAGWHSPALTLPAPATLHGFSCSAASARIKCCSEPRQHATAWRSFASRALPPDPLHLPQPIAENAAPPVIISPQPCRVVVVGWMGSRKRYLRKYAQLWQRSGEYEVLTLRTSIAATLLRWRGVVTAGTDIDRVARMHIECPAMPTIYHIFSTGGFIHVGTMWRWMDIVEDHVLRADLLGEVRGIIFDSGPARVEPEMASRAVVAATLGVPETDLGAMGAALAPPLQAAMSWYLNRPSVKLREREVYEAWEDIAPMCPQLYLYSDADPLAPPKEVEAFMQQQAARGVEVYSHRWADSGHCGHYRAHPHEYAFHISRFMSQALRDWEEEEEEEPTDGNSAASTSPQA